MVITISTTAIELKWGKGRENWKENSGERTIILLVGEGRNLDSLSMYEANEPYVNVLIMNLSTLLQSFKDALTPTNYEHLVEALAAEVTVRLEKNVIKSTFNRLGGLVLDKEVRTLASFLTNATSWSVREKFARLTQMATILNLEKVTEIDDYWGDHDGSLTWRLTPTDVRNVMSLRSDFKADDINKLKL